MGWATWWEPQGVCTTSFTRIAALTATRVTPVALGSAWCVHQREMMVYDKIGGIVICHDNGEGVTALPVVVVSHPFPSPPTELQYVSGMESTCAYVTQTRWTSCSLPPAHHHHANP